MTYLNPKTWLFTLSKAAFVLQRVATKSVCYTCAYFNPKNVFKVHTRRHASLLPRPLSAILCLSRSICMCSLFGSNVCVSHPCPPRSLVFPSDFHPSSPWVMPVLLSGWSWKQPIVWFCAEELWGDVRQFHAHTMSFAKCRSCFSSRSLSLCYSHFYSHTCTSTNLFTLSLMRTHTYANTQKGGLHKGACIFIT